MHRLPLADQLPYRFQPPRLSPFWVHATRGPLGRMLRREHLIGHIDMTGDERVRPLLDKDDGVLLVPNHPGRPDGFILLEAAQRLGRATCVMAAYQIFAGSAGIRKWLFPRLGVFPVDREGSDLAAFKAAVGVLTGPERLLTIFAEGEVYQQADRITPLRDGAATIALTAAKKRADRGQTVWVVPVGLKYRFEPGHNPLPALLAKMSELEAALTWRPRMDNPLVERLYRFGSSLLAIKEIEYLGHARSGALPERFEGLRKGILLPLEAQLFGASRVEETVPVRIKNLRRACLDRLARPEITPEESALYRDWLDDLYLAVQAYSYPGNYVAESPTIDRMAESLTKLDEDLIRRGKLGSPFGPRRAKLHFGEPIDASAFLTGGKARKCAGALTSEIERGIQSALDSIAPGPLLPPEHLLTDDHGARAAAGTHVMKRERSCDAALSGDHQGNAERLT